jgi:hypothetical protein
MNSTVFASASFATETPVKFFVEKSTGNVEHMKRINHTEDNSLFIPMLHSSLVNEEQLRVIIEDKLTLGKVKRVDFVVKPNTQNRYMAFIHFYYWYDNYNTNNFRRLVKAKGYMDVYGFKECIRDKNCYSSAHHDTVVFTDWNNRKCYGVYIENERTYEGQYVSTVDFYNNASVYIRFMMNKTPIQETELNPHQLANNLAVAEKEILDLKTRVAELEETIKKMTYGSNNV